VDIVVRLQLHSDAVRLQNQNKVACDI